MKSFSPRLVAAGLVLLGVVARDSVVAAADCTDDEISTLETVDATYTQPIADEGCDNGVCSEECFNLMDQITIDLPDCEYDGVNSYQYWVDKLAACSESSSTTSGSSASESSETTETTETPTATTAAPSDSPSPSTAAPSTSTSTPSTSNSSASAASEEAEEKEEKETASASSSGSTPGSTGSNAASTGGALGVLTVAGTLVAAAMTLA